MLHLARNQFFGNARTVRKIIEEAIKNQHLRLAKLEAAQREKDMIMQLKMEDVEEFKLESVQATEKKSIGFKQGS